MTRTALPQPVRSIRRLVLSVVLAGGAAAAQAQITTTVPNPGPLPDCPLAGLPWACIVNAPAQANGVVGNYEQLRIGQQGSGSLTIGSGAEVVLNSNVRPDPLLVVGDNVGASGALSVVNGGRLSINVPAAGNGLIAGLFIGPFAAPSNAPPGPLGGPSPSTVALIADGGVVSVTKQGGVGVGSAVAVGFGAGSNSSLVLDGGIGSFGSPAAGATLVTTGNLSIGREGTGVVSLNRNATASADFVYLSAIGQQGQSLLAIGFQSIVNAVQTYVGIGLNAITGLFDAGTSQHGTGVVDLATSSSVLNSPLTLGQGGTLAGVGTVSGPVANYGGTIGPGHSPGTLTLDGGYTDVGGHLEIEFGLSGQDQLVVNVPVSMHGTHINFHFIEGFAPQAGFRFDFLDSSQVLQDLQDLSFSYTGLADGFGFDVETGPNGELTFVAITNGVALPLPGSLPLVLLGLWAVAGSRTWRLRTGSTSAPSAATRPQAG